MYVAPFHDAGVCVRESVRMGTKYMEDPILCYLCGEDHHIMRWSHVWEDTTSDVFGDMHVTAKETQKGVLLG